MYLSSREPPCCWWSGRSFGWLVTNRRAREGNLRGEISCLFTHTRASLIPFLSYELGKRLRSVHWPTDSAALPPALCLPDMIVPASRCWRAERQRLPVIFRVLHHCGIFSLSVHLIISTSCQSGHYAAFKSNKGEFRRTWQWMVFSGLRYLRAMGPPPCHKKVSSENKGGIWTNCVWKESYKLYDNHSDPQLDSPLQSPRSNCQSFVQFEDDQLLVSTAL